MSRADQYITFMLDEIIESERRLQTLYTDVVRRQFDFLDEAQSFHYYTLHFLRNLAGLDGQHSPSDEVIVNRQPTRLTTSAIPSVRRHTIPRRTPGRGGHRRTGPVAGAATTTEDIAEVIDAVTQNLSRRANTAFFGTNNGPGGSRLLAPSQQQIDAACSVLLYRDCSSNQTACPVDMVDFQPNDRIMRINACGHVFREANLRRVFRDSPRCPMCRYNIALLRRNAPPLGSVLSATAPQIFSTMVNDGSGNVLEFAMEFGTNQSTTD